MKRLSRLLLRGALLLLPRDRREWGDAILDELDETRGGVESLRWALGGIKVVLLSGSGLARLAAIGVLVGVVGGTFGNHERFIEVRRAGFESWLPALGLALPTAAAGLIAAVLVLRRSRRASAAATGFLALVLVSSAISLANVSPVRPFLDDWQAVHASDARAGHHAEELRRNAALGALGASVFLLFAARRQARRD